VGFLILGLYISAAFSATSPAVRTLLIWLFYITHSLTLLTSLTHLLTHTYTYTLTRSHSLILTYTPSLSLTYSPIHSLTYTYLKTLTLTILAYIHTHIHSIPPFLCGSRSQYTYPTTRTPWRPSGPLPLRGRRGVMCTINGVGYTRAPVFLRDRYGMMYVTKGSDVRPGILRPPRFFVYRCGKMCIFYSVTFAYSYSLLHTHTRSLSLTKPLTLTHSYSPTHSLSLTLTHLYSLTHTGTHTQLRVFCVAGVG